MPNTTQYIHSIEYANDTYEFADNLVRQYIEQHYDSTQSVVKYVNGIFGIQFPSEYLQYLTKIVVDDRIEYQFIYSGWSVKHLFVGVANSDVIGLIDPWYQNIDNIVILIGQTSSQDSLKIQFIFNNIIDSTQFIANTYSNQIPLSSDLNALYPVVVGNIFDPEIFSKILPKDYYFFGGDCSAVIGGSNIKTVQVQIGIPRTSMATIAVVSKDDDINTILQNKTFYLRDTKNYRFVVNLQVYFPGLFFLLVSEEYLLNRCNEIVDIDIPTYEYYINWANSSPTNIGVANGLVPLNSSGKIDTQYLPSYVDDVVELKILTATAPATCSEGDLYYNTTSHVIFEAVDTNTWEQTGTTPETGKIYIDNTTNDIYRWGGSDLIKISNPTVPVQDVQVDGSSVVNSSGIAAISITGKANKSEMSITPGTNANADKTTIQLKEGTSATVLTAHQDISGKQDVISNTVNVTTDNSDTTTRASFNSTTKQFTFYNLKGADGTAGNDGDSAHIVQLVTYDYSLYSYTYDGTTYTNVPTAPPEGAENVVETPRTAQTILPPDVEAAGTYIKHVRIKTWVGDSDAGAVTSDDLYTGVTLAQQISDAIQEILDGNVTTTSND